MFHAHSGWYFVGDADGNVHIEHRIQVRTYDGPALYGPYYVIDAQVDLTADVWTSLIAFVSASGETSDTYQAARAFHLGQAASKEGKSDGTT